jgi:hypothetical protein
VKYTKITAYLSGTRCRRVVLNSYIDEDPSLRTACREGKEVYNVCTVRPGGSAKRPRLRACPVDVDPSPKRLRLGSKSLPRSTTNSAAPDDSSYRNPTRLSSARAGSATDDRNRPVPVVVEEPIPAPIESTLDADFVPPLTSGYVGGIID